MKIIINGIESEEYPTIDETIAKIECWFDVHTKLWTIQKMNKNDDQIGEAEYICGKKEAKARKEELEKEYKLI